MPHHATHEGFGAGTVEVWTGLSKAEAEEPQGGGVCRAALPGPGGGEEENLDTAQVLVRVCDRLLARARRFELTVVKAKVLCGVFPHYHGAGFGEGQILLRLALLRG